MPLVRAVCVFAALLACVAPMHAETARTIQTELQSLTVDPAHAYVIRDLRLRRGDVSIYLNDGTLIFARPVAGRRIAAVFTTAGAETGDAEIVVMPPRPSERASLAAYTQTPNLDEHFSTAVFLFSDDTEAEVERNAAELSLPKPPVPSQELIEKLNQALQGSESRVSIPLVETLLDAHRVQQGIFCGAILGRTIGPFEFSYDPDAFEPIAIGGLNRGQFQLWTAYRPQGSGVYTPIPTTLEDYSLDVTVNDNLEIEATATFTYRPQRYAGRVIPLSLSASLHVEEASVDGAPVEFLQNGTQSWQAGLDPLLLVITPSALKPEVRCTIRIRYSGIVIRKVSSRAVFVGERALWYPYAPTMLANFDLVFHCPERFRLVSTGELMDESVSNHIRTVHRRTSTPEQLAGFNLGTYSSITKHAAGYRIDCFADPSSSENMNGVPDLTASVLAYYSRRWMPLNIHSLAVTPVPGYFGQGFPGLIYLSEVAYVHERDRPMDVRNARGDVFFSRILLPHEIAHQWWGNVVTAADYRSAWLMEAMANYAAIVYVGEDEAATVAHDILLRYRDDLLADTNGKETDSYGPVDFGVRLFNAAGENVWHDIIYEKGSWVLHMLYERLGEAAFRRLQQNVLTEYAGKPLTNDEFRAAASALIPAGQPDRTLNRFFDTWVYGTGIPQLRLHHKGAEVTVNVGEVDDSFTADLPLRCSGGRTHWMTIVQGENTLSFPGSGSCELPKETDFLYRPE